MAAEASEEDKAAQTDSIDQRMIQLGAEKIEKTAVDLLIADLDGKNLF